MKKIAARLEQLLHALQSEIQRAASLHREVRERLLVVHAAAVQLEHVNAERARSRHH